MGDVGGGLVVQNFGLCGHPSLDEPGIGID